MSNAIQLLAASVCVVFMYVFGVNLLELSMHEDIFYLEAMSIIIISLATLSSLAIINTSTDNYK